jgi:hypothetical protein
MSDVGTTMANPTCVPIAVRVGRDGWVRKVATLHYEANRLVRAEGIEFAREGSMGLTGTMYVVKESFCRDNRSVMRVERQKIVNGIVVELQNWGEIDDPERDAAGPESHEMGAPSRP